MASGPMGRRLGTGVGGEEEDEDGVEPHDLDDVGVGADGDHPLEDSKRTFPVLK